MPKRAEPLTVVKVKNAKPGIHVDGGGLTPKTNGKAERFIQTSIREWAYGTAFQTSAERTRAMHPWLHNYNTQRPHSALKGLPPVSRINKDNVLGNDI